ncbi:MAG: enoyl-CoA hydratase/isomerase family protein, partial [Candidatus Hermodarchaeota archaeon]
YEKEDETGICTLTFNIPERRNALSFISLLEIETILAHMEEDKTAKVLIITGCKEANAFTSGGYYNAKMLTNIPPEIKEDINLMDMAQKRLCLKFWDFSKPVIAAINGLAIGAGITLPLVGADLIYMAEDAWLGFYFVKRAVVPEFGNDFILPFYLGFQKAKEILYFGDKITAQQALELGLVNKVLPSEQLLSYAKEQALRLVPPKGPSLSIKLMKKTMHAYFREIISSTLDLENEGYKKLIKTHDFRESTTSLMEKREPIFKGK